LWYLDQFCGKRLHGTSFPHCAIKLVWICNLLYQPRKVSGHVYICVRGIHFVSVSMIFLLIDFRKCSDSVVFFVFLLIDFRKCSDSVVFFVFLLIDFGTVLTVWYFLFFLFFQNLSTKAKRTSKTVVKSMLPWNQFQQPLTMVTATYPCLC
jgi:hypothetical protein